MLKNIQHTLGKNCLVGLSYFAADGEFIKQNILAGKVISVDQELGITLALYAQTHNSKKAAEQNSSGVTSDNHFIIPVDLSCWFKGPKGDFHTSNDRIKITDPDYLITWDVHQTKNKNNTKNTAEGEQQWWRWQPRIQQPQVNKNSQ